ncbi:MAG: MG2 domain-containing protein [Actinomycetota bacterium]|nr:MG2 domain-containing protein [Actinomycetota bacterium]
MGAAGLVALPAAIAWACAPSTGQIGFDRPAYNAGESVTVFGSGFARENPVELTLQPPSGAPQTVAQGTQTNTTGYFETSFALPSGAAPGDYALRATTVPSGAGHGGQTQPTTAASTFKVMAPAGAPAPPPAPAPAIQAPLPGPPPAGRATQPSTRAALSRAVSKCRTKYRARRSTAASKKKRLARRKAACIRRAKKRYG